MGACVHGITDEHDKIFRIFRSSIGESTIAVGAGFLNKLSPGLDVRTPTERAREIYIEMNWGEVARIEMP